MRFIKRLGRRGQNIVEYTVIVSLVSAAITAMSTYVYRSVQAAQKKIEAEFRSH